MKNSLILLALTLAQISCVAQWKSASPLTSELQDIQFIDQYNGFAVAQSGSIGNCQHTQNFFKTIDGGKNWIRMRTGSTYQPRALHFIDNKTGWLASSSSEILKTLDGGMTWTQQNFGVGSGYNDIWFNGQTGFVIGNNGLLRRSTNGGNSWQTIASGSASSLRKIHFSSPLVGVISVSGGNVLYTANGGNSWNNVNFGASAVNGFSFVTEQIGYAVGYINGEGALFKTTNGGSSWSTQVIGAITPLSTFFLDENYGFVVSDGEGIYKTTDGGQSWTVSTTLNGNLDSWREVFFTNHQEGYICGSYGRVMKTSDGGESWISQNAGFRTQVNSVDAIHRDTAYFGDNYGNLYKTVNAGVNIKQLLSTQEDAVQKIIAHSEQDIVAAYSKKVLLSNDGGESWEETFSNDSYSLSDMHFPSPEVGYISAFDSVFLKTIDGGASWTTMHTGFDDYYRTVWFTDEQTGYLASDDYVYKTTDGGETWSDYWLNTFPLSITGYIRDMVFSSDNVGYLINSQKVLWTRNAGLTWEERTQHGGNTINELYMVNDSLGFFTRNSSQGMTIDSCLNMSSESTACLANNWSMHGIDMTDDGDFGYSVGGLGGLMHLREQREILPPWLSLDAYCSGGDMFVGYISKGLYFGESIHQVELSDASGDFSSPTVIGSIDMDGSTVYQSSVVYCQIPSGLSGTGFRVRVVNTASGIISVDNGFDISISSSITPSLSIAGTTPSGICPGDPVEIIATHSGGGLNPALIWRVNDEIVQEGSSFYNSGDLEEGDIITLEMNSSLLCASSTMVLSNEYQVTTSPAIEIGLADAINACENTDLELTANDQYSYQWQPEIGLSASDVSNPTLNIDVETLFHITATDENGCTITDSLLVSIAPIPEILSTDTTICVGNTLQLNATAGGTYSWSPSNLLDAGDIANPTATIEENTTFILEMNSVDGCFKRDSVQVNLDMPIQILTPDSSICFGESISLDAQSAESYSWSPALILSQTDVSNPTASPDSTVLVFLDAFSNLGCAYRDSILLTVFNPVDVSFINDSILCPGNCIELNPEFSAEVMNYEWSPATGLSSTTEVNPTACPEEGTVYTLNFEDENQCSNQSSFSLLIYDEVSSIEILFNDSLYTTFTGESYQWYLNGEIIDGATEPVYTPLENGNYSLSVTDDNGCEGLSAEIEVILVGLEELAQPLVSVFPNPVITQSFNIQLSTSQAVSIRADIFDLNGRLVHSESFINKGLNELQLPFTSKGVYILKLQVGQNSSSYKLVVN